MDHLKGLVRQDRRILEAIVPQLPPEELLLIIQSNGLEECGELIMLATAEQLTQIFDLDLWRPAHPGTNEQLDAERFGLWLEVLVDVDPNLAAQKLTELNTDLVIAGLSQHVRVLDIAVVAGIREPDDGLITELGCYRVIARRTDSWDAIVSILVSLDGEHPDYFHRVMRGCRALSNAGFEPDVQNLHSAEEQHLFDLFIGREGRREQQGYVTPEQARAFLESARSNSAATVPQNLSTEAVQLAGASLQMMRTQMKFLFEHDQAAYEKRSEEISYIANNLISGCPLQGRAFTAPEASHAAVSVCNLGLEYSEVLANDFLLHQDLITTFQVGWAVLYKEVCLQAASQLMSVLVDLRSDDRYIRKDLYSLRLKLSRWSREGTPWRARDAMEVIAILDAPSWAALIGLIDECPVLHAAANAATTPQTHSVNASDFQFISEKRQIASVRKFMSTLLQELQKALITK